MMKALRALLLLVLLGGMLTGTSNTAFAQAIAFDQPTYNVLIPGNQSLIDVLIPIRNTSNSTLAVRVREVSRDNPNSIIVPQICVGATCYPPDNVSPPMRISLARQNRDSSFKLTLNRNGASGTGTFRYRIYTVDASGHADQTDSSDVTVSITLEPTSKSVLQQRVRAATLGIPYPNPADESTSVSLSLPSRFATAQLRVIDLLGREAYRQPLSASNPQTTVALSTRTFKSGIYFIALEIDGKAIATQRLLVAHD